MVTKKDENSTRQQPDDAETKRSFWSKLWTEWIRPIAPVVIVLLAFRSAVADWNDVPTGSMRPTILEGERIFVNKMAYDLKIPFTGVSVLAWEGPDRGDVVVFRSPKDGVRMVKRVVGVPGDTIELNNNRIYINGELLEYEPVEPDNFIGLTDEERAYREFFTETIGDREHPIIVRPSGSAYSTFKKKTIPEDHYFMMGDNRDNSGDSRIWGFVSRERIAGKATRIVVSFDPDSWWPRWGRFMHDLP